MDLSARIAAGRKSELTTWANFKGIDVELVYIDFEALNRILASCKKTVWVKHQPMTDTDPEKLAGEVSKYIRAWRGFTLEKAMALLPIEQEEGEDPAAEIPCNQVNKVAMLMGCYDFGDWVQSTMTEIANFRKAELETEIKN